MEIGKINNLRISRESEYGYYLEDKDGEEVLLPNAYVKDEMMPGDEIEVFIYRDSEDRLVATTLMPLIQRGEFAYLRIKEVNKFGAFADWGLPKDLMIPFAEQSQKMKEGNNYLIYLLLDEQSERLVGSSKINKFIERDNIDLDEGDEVDLLLYKETDLGMNAIINNRYQGLIFHSHIHKNLSPGEKMKA
ncbi:MAG: S1 RNA-binding domain-containing protein, partial [Bacteroidota bacterium]